MKKSEIITDFLVGGCIGKTLMEVSGIVTNLVFGNLNSDLITQLTSLIIIFLIGGIGFIIAKMSVRKIEKKDLRAKDRQKLLKNQMLVTAVSILFFSVFVVIYIIQRNYVGIILALSFCTLFSLW